MVGTGPTFHLCKKPEKDSSSCFLFLWVIGNGEPGDMRGNKTGSPLGLKLIRLRLSDLIPATPLMSLHCKEDHTFKIPSCTGDLRVNFYDLAGVYFQPLLLSCRSKVEQAYSLRLFTILQLYLGDNWKILSVDDILKVITALCLCRTMFLFLGDNMRKYLILRSQ